MNYLYLNNSSQQPISRSFVFNKRNEKIDWRRIAAVDVDRIARELDFQVLQDNIEHITLCNIDMEVDTRAMDPNFIKLYKMAQLIIEYLLLCQDQISNQLADYEQNKSKNFLDQEEFRRQLEKLKNDLNQTKKESKKRKKMIETQQKMLMTQHSNHHPCPVCGHSFLSIDYLQAHIHRRHPEYGPNGRREHDVDIEKEIQRLKDELNNKEKDLQLIKVQKTVDEEKIRDRDGIIRQLKEEIQSLTTKITILDEKYFTLRSSTQNRTPSPHRHEGGVKELLKENKNLRIENEQLRQSLQQTEDNLKKEQKLKRRFERDNQNLQREIDKLNDNLRTLQNPSGDTNQLSEQFILFRNKYDEEKNRRKKLQDQLNDANNQLAEYRNQPPPIIDRKSPTPYPRSSVSPPPTTQTVVTRPIQTTEIFLPQYCPSLVRKINENPRYLNVFRNNTINQFNDELEQYDDLRVKEKDIRLNDNDYKTKMNIIERTRQNIQNDLPNFERIRAELSRTLDKIVNERINPQRTSVTSLRSSGGKLVTFEDTSQQQQIKRPSTAITTVHSRPNYDQNRSSTNFGSDEEKTNTDESDDEHARFVSTGVTNNIQPSPRKNIPTTGVSALAAGSMRPSITNNTKTISTLVRPQSKINNYESESDSDNPAAVTNVATKTKKLDKKLEEINAKGQKPTINAIAQGFQPSHKTLNPQNDDDESDSSLTSINDTNINSQRKISTGHSQQNIGRESATNHHHLSSGDVSQYTYDSLWKSPTGKGSDFRRPLTADSAKTSDTDSDENLEEVSN